MAEMQIKIAADVSSAVSGLDKLGRELDQTGKDAVQLGNAVENAGAKIRTLPGVTGQATSTLTNFSRVVQDAPFGLIGIANNIDPLISSFQQLKATTGTTGGAFKALVGQLAGPAGVALAISTVTSLLITFGDRLFTTSKTTQKVASDADKLKEAINGIFTETAKEATAVNGFLGILRNETETRERKLSAIKELQQIQPQIFSGLKLEGEAVVGLDNAYKNYLENLKTVIAVKIKQAQLEQLIEKQLKLQGVTLTANEKTLVDGTKRFQELLSNDPRLQGTDASRIKQYYTDQENQSKKTLNALQRDIAQLQSEITQLSAGIQTKPLTLKPEKVKVEIPKIANLGTEAIEIPPITQEVVVPLTNVQFEFLDLDKTKQLATLRAEFESLGLQLPPINVQAIIQNPEVLEYLNKQLNQAYQQFNQVAGYVSGTFAPAFDGLFNTIEKGGDAIGGFFQGLSEGIKDLVQALIQTAAIAGLVSLITGTPFATSFKLLAGITLPGRANGGPVSGGNPYMVGERGPELFVPAVSGSIVPNNAVGSFMSGRQSGGSGMSVLRGQDIILAYARTQRSQLRVNG
jgi:hypothetical protein